MRHGSTREHLITTGLKVLHARGYQAALAGFGTGSRLEYLMVPIAFGVGGPLVAIVGTNIGAGQRVRALCAAWIGGAIGFTITEAAGITAAVWPVAWL